MRLFSIGMQQRITLKENIEDKVMMIFFLFITALMLYAIDGS